MGMNVLFQDIVYLAFKWEEGDYYFIRHREPQSGFWQLLQSTANLIMGGIRRITKLQRMKGRLPKDAEILQLSQDPLARFQNVSLKSEEKEILHLIDGRKTFGVILNIASLVTDKARFILYGLLESGLIEIRKTMAEVQDDLSDEELVLEEEIDGADTAPKISIQDMGGNLLIEPVPAILFTCFRSALTGEVIFDSEDIIKNVHFIDGQIVYARSNLEGERLGDILFQLERIDEKNFNKALRIQEKHKNKRIGTILLDQGFLTEDQLRLAIQLQIKKIVVDIFNWPKGSYILKEKKIRDESEVTVSVSTPNIIMEGIRNIQDDQLLRRFLPRDDLPLKKVSDFELLTKHFDFTEGERQVTRMIDGKKTLKDLIAIFKIGRLNVFGFFFGLYVMKLMEIVHEPVKKPAAVYEGETADLRTDSATVTVKSEPEPQRDSDEFDFELDFGTEEPEQPVRKPVSQPVSPFDEVPQTAPVETPPDTTELEKQLDERESAQAMFDEYYNIVQTGDFYRILAVDQNASVPEIKMSYRKLAKKFHPDTIYVTGITSTHDVLNEIFLKINEAYQTLNNPSSREEYNRTASFRKPGETDEDLELRADMAFQEGLKQMRYDKFLEAADHFREAIRLFPKKSIYHTRLVETYLNAQVPARRIIRTALEAVRLEPGLADAHLVLGRVYLELQDFKRASEEIEKALELDPVNTKAQKWKQKIEERSG
ncbi:DUF4388 domain-containing protein [candidate division CSSED10-310 bacterium]|uniref:DUF4388 domain-containing protein n=1 Tax=candidate division CSSED10-310 bacterium TaxID=2855610 RepID=A0ABV6YVA0_UNCC1